MKDFDKSVGSKVKKKYLLPVPVPVPKFIISGCLFLMIRHLNFFNTG